MQAIVQDRYGPPGVLELREVPDPVPGPGQVLVRVGAAALNAYDWHHLRGDPYLARLSFGVRRPKATIRGRDVAGRVEAVGAGVTRLRPGDEVFGDLGAADGAFAELVAAPEAHLAVRPAALPVEQAAAMPLAGTTALRGLRDVGGVRAGQQVLINGASGGVGTFAVQIGKALGASVTGVCSARNAELVRSLGADDVIVYTEDDFARGDRRWDAVLDLVGNRSLADLRRAVTPDGIVLLSGGGVPGGGGLVGPLALIVRGRIAKLRRHRVVDFDAPPSRRHLEDLLGFVEAGTVSPVVERTYPLADVADAFHHLEREHARAKIVITI